MKKLTMILIATLILMGLVGCGAVHVDMLPEDAMEQLPENVIQQVEQLPAEEPAENEAPAAAEPVEDPVRSLAEITGGYWYSFSSQTANCKEYRFLSDGTVTCRERDVMMNEGEYMPGESSYTYSIDEEFSTLTINGSVYFFNSETGRLEYQWVEPTPTAVLCFGYLKHTNEPMTYEELLACCAEYVEYWNDTAIVTERAKDDSTKVDAAKCIGIWSSAKGAQSDPTAEYHNYYICLFEDGTALRYGWRHMGAGHWNINRDGRLVASFGKNYTHAPGYGWCRTVSADFLVFGMKDGNLVLHDAAQEGEFSAINTYYPADRPDAIQKCSNMLDTYEQCGGYGAEKARVEVENWLSAAGIK